MATKFLAAATVIIGLLLAAPALARADLGAPAAKRAAIAILLGDPYGRTAAQVSRHIVGQQRLADDVCHTGKRVWKFHVVLPPSATLPDGADGYLVLDAATGKLVCAGLPLLD